MLVAAASWALCPGCLDHDGAPEPGDEFVAFQSDFADFQQWNSYYLGDGALGDSTLVGPRTAYMNIEPQSGSAQFPVGTMIVKTAEVADSPVDWVVIGMAKRGAGYNADGAVGWEWFDLECTDSGSVVIDWRGLGPPEGQGYECALGSDTGDDPLLGDCSTCHAAASSNDYVLSEPLQLSAF